MKERILEINPDCQVEVHKCFFLPENADEFQRISEYRRVDQAGDPHGAIPCDSQRQSRIAGPLPLYR